VETVLPDEKSRPAGNGATVEQPHGDQASSSVTDRRAAERSRRSRRWARQEFDDLFRHVPPSSITTAGVLALAIAPARFADSACLGLHDGDHDYWGACTGMNLGMPERRAAALRLLGREAA
jgi:hypothetical protein